MKYVHNIISTIDIFFSIYFFVFIYYVVQQPTLCNITRWVFGTIALWFLDYLYLWYFQKKLQDIEFEEITQLQIADLNYVGTYISYFIIGVGLPSVHGSNAVFYVILSLLFIFLARTKTVGFNIFHLLNGWHYYNVTNQDNFTMTVLLKRNDLRKVKNLKLLLLHNNIFIGTV